MARITHIWRLLLYLAWIIDKVRASFITGIALSAWDLAFVLALLAAYVSLAAAFTVLASVLQELLPGIYRFVVTMLSYLL